MNNEPLIPSRSLIAVGGDLLQACDAALLELEIKKRLRNLWRRQCPSPAKKQCPTCSTVLRNLARTYCSKRCVCAAMTQRIMSPEYYQQRAEQQQQQRVLTQCKICHKEMGWRVPGSVQFCSRECVGKDPDIRASKSAKRKKLWADPEYRQKMAEYAIARNADPTNGFGKHH